MRPRWGPFAMDLLAIVLALGATLKAVDGQALTAIVMAINGATTALVALGYHVAARPSPLKGQL